MKFYDRTKALKMMYALKEQGFINIGLKLDNELYIHCDIPSGKLETPDITGDFVEDWTTGGIKSRGELNGDFWWIFD
jgi:hypothetical protein